MTAAVQAASSPSISAKKHEWAPRFWEGMDFFAWVRLLARNHFAIGWRYWYIAVVVTLVSLGHTLLRFLQQAIYGRRIARTALHQPPIFIVGHWRTGTTWLHELLVLDERHSYPNTYECLEPNHFLLTERLITRWFGFLMPAHRPMDNMAAGWMHPQEDEFALCMMGQPSPYLTIAFPNRPPQYPEYLDLQGLPARSLASWQRTYLGFLKRLTYKNRRRLVLKSPTHTARIEVLRKLLPGAQFIHIVRDPYVVFPSTVNLWKSLYQAHGLQTPTFEGLEEHVFKTFERLYARMEEVRPHLKPSEFYELRYEDLRRDPVGQIRHLYEHFNWPGFEDVRPRLEQYVADTAGYETNRYQCPQEIREKIGQRWGFVAKRYGYSHV